MFRFFFKKNFSDIWDNLFHFIILNLVFIAAIFGLGFAFFGISLIPVHKGVESIVMVLIILAACIAFSILLFAEGDNCAKIANFEGPKLGAYFKNIPSVLPDAVKFGLFVGALIIIALVSMPYYFGMWLPSDGSQGNIMGLACLSLVFWFEVISMLSLQWFLAIRNLMHNNFKKCLKKSYIIFFDNAAFSIGVALVNLLNLAVTVLTLGLIPGLHGMTLTNTNALRIRLYKYDWLEVNPGLTPKERKDVPWEDLIANDKRTLGPRKWKSFIFPWKE